MATAVAEKEEFVPLTKSQVDKDYDATEQLGLINSALRARHQRALYSSSPEAKVAAEKRRKQAAADKAAWEASAEYKAFQAKRGK